MEYIENSIKEKLATVYNLQGAISFSELPILSTFDKFDAGKVWYIKDSFVTDSRFSEGYGISVPAGTNVALVLLKEGFRYDILGSLIDVSLYYTKTEIIDLVVTKSMVGEPNGVAPLNYDAVVNNKYLDHRLQPDTLIGVGNVYGLGASVQLLSLDGPKLLMTNYSSDSGDYLEVNRFGVYYDRYWGEYVDGNWIERTESYKLNWPRKNGTFALIEDLPEDYVKFTDYAQRDKKGIVQVYGGSAAHGLNIIDGGIYIVASNTSNIDKREANNNPSSSLNLNPNNFQPIVPATLDYAVKAGVTTNTIPLTDEEKASACDWLGAIKNPMPLTNSVLTLDGGGTGKVTTRDYTNYMPYADRFYILADETQGDTINGTGYFLVNTPKKPYHGANKKYVDERNPKYTYAILITYAYGDYDIDYDWYGIMFQFHSNTDYTITSVQTLLSALPEGKVFPVTQSVPGSYSPRDYVYSIRRVGNALVAKTAHWPNGQGIVFDSIKVEKIENY